METVRRGLLEFFFMLYSNPFGKAYNTGHRCSEEGKIVQVQNVQYDNSVSRSDLKQICFLHAIQTSCPLFLCPTTPRFDAHPHILIPQSPILSMETGSAFSKLTSELVLPRSLSASEM